MTRPTLPPANRMRQPRNGPTDLSNPAKRDGAGRNNWGTLDDEIIDQMEEAVARKDEVPRERATVEKITVRQRGDHQ